MNCVEETAVSVKDEEIKIKLASFQPNFRRVVVLSRHGKEVTVYNLVKGAVTKETLETLINYKATGGVVEACFYSQNGLRFFQSEEKSLEARVEVWRPIFCAKGSKFTVRDNVEVSNLGGVRYKMGTEYYHISRHSTQKGPCVELPVKPFGTVEMLVADLVAHAFVPKPAKTQGVVFIDGNHNNVSACNLGWRVYNKRCESDRSYTYRFCTMRCYRSDGRLAADFPTMNDAYRSGLGSEADIRRSCETKCAIKVGEKCYIWRYIARDEFLTLSEQERAQKVGSSIVRQYSIDGELLSEYPGVAATAASIGADEDSVFRSCSNQGFTTLCNGYLLRFAFSDKLYELSESERKKKLRSKYVRQYSQKGELVDEYLTTVSASMQTGATSLSIANSCSRSRLFADGFIWRYAYDDELYDLCPEERMCTMFPRRVNQYSLDGKLVKYYNTVDIAAKALSIYVSKMREFCARSVIVEGYVWRLASKDRLAGMSEEKRAEYIARNFSVCETYEKVEEKKGCDISVFHDVPKELHAWYTEVQRVGVGTSERWVPAPYNNIRRPDGTWKYDVSSKGRVKLAEYVNARGVDCDSRILGLEDSSLGPRVIMTSLTGARVPVLVSKLVAVAFVSNPDGLKEVRHKDGDMSNNNYTNLEWVAEAEHPVDNQLKGIRMYLPDGSIANEYDSSDDAAQDLGSTSAAVRRCCRKKRISKDGFVWRYIEDDDLYDLTLEERASKIKALLGPRRIDDCAVRKYSIDGELIEEYPSLYEAKKAVGAGSSLAYCCDRRPGYETCHGFIWRYANADELAG